MNRSPHIRRWIDRVILPRASKLVALARDPGVDPAIKVFPGGAMLILGASIERHVSERPPIQPSGTVGSLLAAVFAVQYGDDLWVEAGDEAKAAAWREILASFGFRQKNEEIQREQLEFVQIEDEQIKRVMTPSSEDWAYWGEYVLDKLAEQEGRADE
jgi:hypothetical protein